MPNKKAQFFEMAGVNPALPSHQCMLEIQS